MKRAFLWIATALLLIAQAAAPTFTLRDQNGRRISLAAAHGQKVVLVFYRGYW